MTLLRKTGAYGIILIAVPLFVHGIATNYFTARDISPWFAGVFALLVGFIGAYTYRHYSPHQKLADAWIDAGYVLFGIVGTILILRGFEFAEFGLNEQDGLAALLLAGGYRFAKSFGGLVDEYGKVRNRD